MQELKWSQTEKAIARKAFDLALKREFEDVIREVKTRAGKIEEPSALWDLEAYLGKRRKRIDSTYDYRYSVLPLVFAGLIVQGRLSEEELRGIGDEKVEYILGITRI
jgi:hypothetical protein